MATTTNLTTSYAGEVAGEYLMKAFLANESLQHFTIKDNVPGKLKIRRIQDNRTTFQTPSCDFTPGGTLDLDERTLQLVDLSYQTELCKIDFLQDWEALAAQNDDISSVSEALVLNTLGNISQINETMIWQGTAGTNSYAGLITLIDADSTVNFVASPAVVDESNVIDKIKLLVAECPLRIKRAPEKPKIYAASDVVEHYQNKIASLGYNNQFNASEAIRLMFNGLYEIVDCPGMPSSTMIMAQKSNIWFGTNKLSDWNNVATIDLQPVTGDKKVRFDSSFYAAVNYGWGNEIAAYGPGLS